MSASKDQLKDWLGQKKILSGNVLSVGNKNDDGEYFFEYTPEEVKTIDIHPEFNPDYYFDFNGNFFGEMLSQVKGHFDHVFTFGLWNYIWDAPQALRNCEVALRPGGKLWIYASFIHPQMNSSEKDYCRYTKKFWQDILPKFGFEIIEMEAMCFTQPEYFIKGFTEDGNRLSKEADHTEFAYMIVAKKINPLE